MPCTITSFSNYRRRGALLFGKSLEVNRQLKHLPQNLYGRFVLGTRFIPVVKVGDLRQRRRLVEEEAHSHLHHLVCPMQVGHLVGQLVDIAQQLDHVGDVVRVLRELHFRSDSHVDIGDVQQSSAIGRLVFIVAAFVTVFQLDSERGVGASREPGRHVDERCGRFAVRRRKRKSDRCINADGRRRNPLGHADAFLQSVPAQNALTSYVQDLVVFVRKVFVINVSGKGAHLLGKGRITFLYMVRGILQPRGHV